MMRRNLRAYSLAAASGMLRAEALHGMHGNAHLERQHSGGLAQLRHWATFSRPAVGRATAQWRVLSLKWAKDRAAAIPLRELQQRHRHNAGRLLVVRSESLGLDHSLARSRGNPV